MEIEAQHSAHARPPEDSCSIERSLQWTMGARQQNARGPDPVKDSIVSSPYADDTNLLDLQTLSVSARLFALALTALQPIRPDYATAPLTEAFNWPTVFDTLQDYCHRSSTRWEGTEFYVVTFRSKLRPGIDRGYLGELDKHSHEEACASGGLLKYWFGDCDVERQNLATCVWQGREDAARGGSGPWHRKARMAACDMYEYIAFDTYRLIVSDGAKHWRLEQYSK